MNITSLWRDVVGYEGLYEVSNNGDVRSLIYGRPRSLGKIYNGGYYKVNLCKNSKTRSVAIHHLVLEAFVGPRPDGLFSCHNNGNSKDNRLENLRWDTPQSNAADRKIHGTNIGPRGSKQGNAKLTENDFITIRRRLDKGDKGSILAQEYSVSQATVSEIKHRKVWRHIT